METRLPASGRAALLRYRRTSAPKESSYRNRTCLYDDEMSAMPWDRNKMPNRSSTGSYCDKELLVWNRGQLMRNGAINLELRGGPALLTGGEVNDE